jgi:hypothetical protein
MPGLQPPKLVLGTNSAVLWADIPALGHDYQLNIPAGIPQNQCLGLAAGPDNRVIATPTGAPDKADANGAYFGTWLFGKLVMQRATHLGDIDLGRWRCAVVASCAGNPSVCYAAVSASGVATASLRRAFAAAGVVTAPLSVQRLAQTSGFHRPISLAALIRRVDPPQGNDLLYAVLASQDGGATWAPVGPNRQVAGSIRLSRDPGVAQGDWNLSISVSPVDPKLMALGWRIGPWIGRDTPTAFTWRNTATIMQRPAPRALISIPIRME